MNVGLVRQQLCGGDVLNGNGIVRSVRNDGIALSVIMGSRHQSSHVGEDRLADLDGVCCGAEMSEGNLTKIRSEEKRIVTCCDGEVHRAGTGDLAGRPIWRRGLIGCRCLVVNNGSAAGVVREFEVGL
jgi:hypothetical protein